VDFMICELGGTVGDIEGLPFLEAIRQLRVQLGRDRTLFMHLTLIPYIASAGELKTKPTQHSVKELQSLGIQPDILLCRCDRPIPDESKAKLALFCNMQPQSVIEALDVSNIYEVPVSYHKMALDVQVLNHFDLATDTLDLSPWTTLLNTINAPKGTVNIGVVGKYLGFLDAYKSINESLIHGALALGLKLNLQWIDSDVLEETPEKVGELLSPMDGVLVPGGFGLRGSEGKIAAIRWVRENNKPYLGICFGMQLASLDFARNKVGIKDATSAEFEQKGTNVITQVCHESNLGGSLRVGSNKITLAPGSKAHSIYESLEINERHRHRFGVDVAYKEALETEGAVFSGQSSDGKLLEIFEIPSHPWFVAVQFHPEFKSKPFKPHPLFRAFVKASIDLRKENTHDKISAHR